MRLEIPNILRKILHDWDVGNDQGKSQPTVCAHVGGIQTIDVRRYGCHAEDGTAWTIDTHSFHFTSSIPMDPLLQGAFALWKFQMGRIALPCAEQHIWRAISSRCIVATIGSKLDLSNDPWHEVAEGVEKYQLVYHIAPITTVAKAQAALRTCLEWLRSVATQLPMDLWPSSVHLTLRPPHSPEVRFQIVIETWFTDEKMRHSLPYRRWRI